MDSSDRQWMVDSYADNERHIETNDGTQMGRRQPVSSCGVVVTFFFLSFIYRAIVW